MSLFKIKIDWNFGLISINNNIFFLVSCDKLLLWKSSSACSINFPNFLHLKLVSLLLKALSDDAVNLTTKQ